MDRGETVSFQSCLILLMTLLIAGYPNTSSNNSPTVTYVLPDDYTGYFWVFEDPVNGVESKRSPDGLNITVVVPQNGVVRLAKSDFLLDWHKLSAKTYSGNKVPVAAFDDPQPDELAVRSLSSSAEGVHTYLVGTLSDVNRFYDNMGMERQDARNEFMERLSSEIHEGRPDTDDHQ